MKAEKSEFIEDIDKGAGLELDHVKGTVRDHWDTHSKYYDGKKIDPGYTDDLDRRFSEDLANTLGRDKKVILDVGSGTGYISVILAMLGHTVTGVDFSKKMLAISAEKAKKLGMSIKFIEGDAENLPFEDNSFDAVVNRHLLWTLPNPEKAVQEWFRLAKPGGKMVIIDGTQSSKVKKLLGKPLLVYILIKEGRTLKEILNYSYPEDVSRKIPNVNGITAEKIASYMRQSGIENISIRDLEYVNHISGTRSSIFKGFIIKSFFEYHTYLVAGDIPSDKIPGHR
jgi:ubiquinone/menaquinone biosynthesis C-methylase UbiE